MEKVFEFLRLKEDVRKELRIKLVGVTPTMLAHIDHYSALYYLEQLKIPKILAAGIAVTSLYFESRKYFIKLLSLNIANLLLCNSLLFV